MRNNKQGTNRGAGRPYDFDSYSDKFDTWELPPPVRSPQRDYREASRPPQRSAPSRGKTNTGAGRQGKGGSNRTYNSTSPNSQRRPSAPPQRQRQQLNRQNSAGTQRRQRPPQQRGRDVDYVRGSINREERRRKQNERRRKRLRRRRILLSTFLILTTLVVTIVLCLTVFFKMNKIDVKGNSRYTAQQVLDSVDFRIGENMFLIGSNKQEESIETRLPYIQQADIKLSLPATVVINVKETTAKYAYLSGDKYILLDSELKVLEKDIAELPEGVIILSGPKFKSANVGTPIVFEDEAVKENTNSLLAAVEKAEMSDITAIELTNASTNYIVYQNRIRIKLGALTNLEYKLDMAKAAIAKESSDAKGTLDVTIDKVATFTQDKE